MSRCSGGAHRRVDRDIKAARLEKHRDLGSASIGRHRQQQRARGGALRQGIALGFLCGLSIAIGCIEDQGRGRGRRVERIDGGLDRMIAHIEKPRSDREAQPYAARRMASGAGLDLDVEQLGTAAARDRPPGDIGGQEA